MSCSSSAKILRQTFQFVKRPSTRLTLEYIIIIKVGNHETHLKTSNDCSGERRVVLRAQHGRVHEHKAHDTGEKEKDAKCPRGPAFELHQAVVPVVGPHRHQHQRYDHEEGVIVEQTILAKLLRVELLLEKHSVARREHVVEQHKGVAVQIKAKIVAATKQTLERFTTFSKLPGGQECSSHHHKNGRLNCRA